MTKARPRAMHPSDFQVNQTWLAYRINQAPIRVGGTAVDLYVLQDAASMFLFGHALATPGTEGPESSEVESLLDSAYSKGKQWPSELVMPGVHGAGSTFSKAALQRGIAVRSIPESQMSLYIKDTQEGYEEFLTRGQGEA
jgi:hypothetical protein